LVSFEKIISRLGERENVKAKIEKNKARMCS